MRRLRRKVIALATSPINNGDSTPDIVAACDDGTIWMLSGSTWMELEPIPQPKVTASARKPAPAGLDQMPLPLDTGGIINYGSRESVDRALGIPPSEDAPPKDNVGKRASRRDVGPPRE